MAWPLEDGALVSYDIVCIAGMIVNTMISILMGGRNVDKFHTTNVSRPMGDDDDNDNDETISVDRVGCERLLLQPTNS